MKFSNYQMDQMLNSLKKQLDRADLIGYAAARNTRILRGELSEYVSVRDELVKKYGEHEVDEGGNATGNISISVTSPKFRDFSDELGRYATIEHEPNLYTLPIEEAIGKLSGAEILELDWMFVEKEADEQAD